MTRMTGPDCAVMCNSIHTHTHSEEAEREAQDTVQYSIVQYSELNNEM